MQTQPDRTRLRIVAIVCWLLGGWLILQPTPLGWLHTGPLLAVALVLAGVIVLALGIAFWSLGTDQRAGVALDDKGLMLNLGHYAAFVAWDNIAALGVSEQRNSLLTLGSARQLGIRLHDPQRYLQSYEERLPASGGLVGLALRLLRGVLCWVRPCHTELTTDDLARMRTRTGYDILIPETLLGQSSEEFLMLVQPFRRDLRLSSETRRLEPRKAM
jgi:hypothetical protein